MVDYWEDGFFFIEMRQDPSGYLESFPTYRLRSKPRPCSDEVSGFKGQWVFSSKDEGYENNSYLPDDVGTRMMIYDKITSAFYNMDHHYKSIAQFWAPVTIGGKHLLSTSAQPFAVANLHKDLIGYRRRCMEEYAYDIDVNSNNNSKFRGTPASAFLNRIPEITFMDRSVHHEVDPLLRYAFHDLSSYFMMPIYCPSQTSSSSDCIGVIECSSSFPDCNRLFREMNKKIKEVGLGVYNVQDRIPYKTINGLELARDQIQEALKIVCQSHQIALAQVWIASLDENHVHFSSSFEEAQTRRQLVLKLTGCIDDDSERYSWRFQTYYDACDLIPIQPGDELVLKTLQDYEPRFCNKISKLGIHKLMRWDCSAAAANRSTTTMGLTICMRSIHTGDFNYVFEFLWNHNSFNPILLEELLLKIKSCLPSFKFASGTEIGDKLHVIEVDNSTDKEIKKFDIFQLKRLSPIPEAMNKGKKAMVVNYNALSKQKRDTTEIELSREDIEQQYGKTMKKAAEELGVSLSTLKRKHNKLGISGWQGPDLLQRKAYNSNKNQSIESHTHEKENGVIQDPSPVKRNENTVIKAEYADDIIRLHLPISEATFVTVENEIGKEFKLKHGTFKINYCDEDEEWILMKTDQDLNDCIQSSRNVDRSVVRLRNEIGKKFKLKHGTFKIKYRDEDEECILMTSDQDLSDCIQNSRTVDRAAVRLRVLLHNQFLGSNQRNLRKKREYNGTTLMITTLMIKDLNKLCTLTKKSWYCGKKVLESVLETGWILCNGLDGWSVMFDPPTRLDVNKIQFTCRTQSLCRIDEKLLPSIILIALGSIEAPILDMIKSCHKTFEHLILLIRRKQHSELLETFPTYQVHSKPRPFIKGIWVFGSKDERYENNSYSLDDVGTRMMIYDKIKSAFSKMDYSDNLIVQFWAPSMPDDIIKLHLPISEATIVTVENEIGERFKLEDGTFKIKFLDKDEEWILMDSDQDLSYCIQNSRNVAVQLRVLLHNQYLGSKQRNLRKKREYNGTTLMTFVYLSLGSVITFTKITTVMINDFNRLCRLTKKGWYCGKEVLGYCVHQRLERCHGLDGWSIMFDPSTRLDVDKIQFTCRTQSLCKIRDEASGGAGGCSATPNNCGPTP
ncbi:NIN-like protein [Artemisia annua]|uniref:NIN-like protein n=1 Tax=Artemisia annua TaxID=35608 RepID=A0A2U1NVL1_ARTAN|nr:NIN-like protein [Artemisia annua]